MADSGEDTNIFGIIFFAQRYTLPIHNLKGEINSSLFSATVGVFNSSIEESD